jgi:nicotinamidase-related amidase
VRATTLDALANCYKVSIIEELRREVSPETTAKAWKEMREKGIAIIGSWISKRSKACQSSTLPADS